MNSINNLKETLIVNKKLLISFALFIFLGCKDNVSSENHAELSSSEYTTLDQVLDRMLFDMLKAFKYTSDPFDDTGSKVDSSFLNPLIVSDTISFGIIDNTIGDLTRIIESDLYVRCWNELSQEWESLDLIVLDDGISLQERNTKLILRKAMLLKLLSCYSDKILH